MDPNLYFAFWRTLRGSSHCSSSVSESDCLAQASLGRVIPNYKARAWNYSFQASSSMGGDVSAPHWPWGRRFLNPIVCAYWLNLGMYCSTRNGTKKQGNALNKRLRSAIF